MATDTLVGLASLVLENNYFEFNDRFHRQKLGTAIGTKFAPACANLKKSEKCICHARSTHRESMTTSVISDFTRAEPSRGVA